MLKRHDSMDEVTLPFTGSIPPALDLTTYRTSGFEPYYHLEDNPTSAASTNTETRQISLLTTDKLKEISAHLALDLKPIAELAMDYKTTKKAKTIHLVAWSSKILHAVSKKKNTPTKETIFSSDSHGTHYLSETITEAGFCYVVTITSDDLETTASFKASLREPKTSIGLSTELSRLLSGKSFKIDTQLLSQNMVLPSLAKGADLPGIIDNLKKLEDALALVKYDPKLSPTSGKYLSYRHDATLLPKGRSDDHLIVHVRILKELCKKLLELIAHFDLYANPRTSALNASLTENSKRIEQINAELRSIILKVNSHDLVNRLKEELSRLQYEAINTCDLLNQIIIQGRSYTLKHKEKSVGIDGDASSPDHYRVKLMTATLCSVYLHHPSSYSPDAIGTGSSAVICTDPIWLEFNGNTLTQRGFLHYTPPKFLGLGEALAVKPATPESLSSGTHTNRYTWTLKSVNSDHCASATPVTLSGAGTMPTPADFPAETDGLMRCGNIIQINSALTEFAGHSICINASNVVEFKNSSKPVEFSFSLNPDDSFNTVFFRIKTELASLIRQLSSLKPLATTSELSAAATATSTPFSHAMETFGETPAAGGAGASSSPHVPTPTTTYKPPSVIVYSTMRKRLTTDTSSLVSISDFT